MNFLGNGAAGSSETQGKPKNSSGNNSEDATGQSVAHTQPATAGSSTTQ